MSTLAGLPIHRAELAIPALGAWRADVILASGEAPSGAVELVVGDLTLQGTVLRSGLDAPARPHAVVVGAPGWERPLERPLSYQSDAGVRLSTVLQDLATLADEPIEQPTDAQLGRHFAAPMSRTGDPVYLRTVLSALQRTGTLAPWRVDPDGVTRFGARTGSAVTARATVLGRNEAVGQRRLGIDSPASFLPGNTLDGEPIVRLVIREKPGRLEAEVWHA